MPLFTFISRCPAGFVGPRCEGDVNECLSSPCSKEGTQACVQLINNYRCDCIPGWTGMYKTCSNWICDRFDTEEKWNFESIESPFILSLLSLGKHCEHRFSFCDPNPCQHNGLCSNGNYGAQCECPEGRSGDRCQLSSSACHSNPCKNGGSCEPLKNGFICDCIAGVQGESWSDKHVARDDLLFFAFSRCSLQFAWPMEVGN